MQMTLRTVSLTVLINLVPGTALGAIYKWVAADGSVTYSSQRPPGKEVQEIDAPRSRDADRRLQVAPEAPAQTGRGESTAGVTEGESDIDALFRKNCEVARRNLHILESSSSVTDVDADGKVYLVENEERAARTGQAQANIDRYCK